ncbi:uncharacterized protein LOC143038196 isoform X2 [Oratosquilla oratoria]
MRPYYRQVANPRAIALRPHRPQARKLVYADDFPEAIPDPNVDLEDPRPEIIELPYPANVGEIVLGEPNIEFEERRPQVDGLRHPSRVGEVVFAEPNAEFEELHPEVERLQHSASVAEGVIAQSSNSHPHASGQNDHVDYGAYTGGHGAFGWYSDHPVHIQYH